MEATVVICVFSLSSPIHAPECIGSLVGYLKMFKDKVSQVVPKKTRSQVSKVHKFSVKKRVNYVDSLRKCSLFNINFLFSKSCFYKHTHIYINAYLSFS